MDENDFLVFLEVRRGGKVPGDEARKDHFLTEPLHVEDLAIRPCHYPHRLSVRWHKGTRPEAFVKGEKCPCETLCNRQSRYKN